LLISLLAQASPIDGGIIGLVRRSGPVGWFVIALLLSFSAVSLRDHHL
jgi:hypothetical protein